MPGLERRSPLRRGDRSYILMGLAATLLVAPTTGGAARPVGLAASVVATSAAAATAAVTGTTASYCPQRSAACDYVESWQVQALLLQNRLDVNVPIHLAGLPHSHNAFNARKDGYHTDPNHDIGVGRQLETGVRSFAYDIGAYPTGSAYQSTHSIRLCHKICSDQDVFLGEGLRTIRDYLRSDEGKDEVLFLQLELNMPLGNKGDYVRDVRKKIAAYLGDLVYRPPGGACTDWHTGVAATVTKAQVRAAGKNIVINSKKGCYDSDFQTWVFKGTWKESINLGSNQPHFSGYPNCTYGTKYDAAEIQAGFFRSFNDGTTLSAVDTETSSLTVEQMEKLRGCGVNALGPEPLEDWMDRWKVQVWSWAENEPSVPFGRYERPPAANDDDCALHGNAGRFVDSKCHYTRVFACQHPQNRDWKLTATPKAWSQGEQACQAAFGADGYVFSLPVNGYENNTLIDAKNAAGVSGVWIAYSDLSREGDWRPGAPVPPPEDPPTTHDMLAGGDGWNGDYYTTAIAFGDVDGDGLDEVGVSRYATGGTRYWILDDAEHDFVELFSGGSGWNSDYYATTIAFGDVDGDGRDEVGVGRRAYGGDRMWIFDDANAGFSELYAGGSGWNKDYYVLRMAFGDVDGDGRDEVGVARYARDGARWFVLRRSGSSFTTIHEGGKGWNSKNYATAIAFGDVDGDGRDEIGVGRKAESGARYFVLDDTFGSTLLEGGSGWNSDYYPTSIAFGNVDGDARAEMGITRYSRDSTRFWVLDDKNAGFGTLTWGGGSWGSSVYPTSIAFGDLDGDGQDEFGVTRKATSNSRWFVFEGSNGQYDLLTEGGADWNDKAEGRSIAFGKTFDAQVDIGLGRGAPDNARYFVYGWN
jgi:hypothetical protein